MSRLKGLNMSEKFDEAVHEVQKLENDDEALVESEVHQRYLTFILDKEEYAIEISKVWEIRIWEQATYLPLSEHFVKGVINTRGSIIPIIDLRLRFGLDEIEPTQNTTIILVQVNDEERSRLLGIIVDEVRDIHDIPINDIQTELETGGKNQAGCVMGTVNVNDKFLILLDQNKFLDISNAQE